MMYSILKSPTYLSRTYATYALSQLPNMPQIYTSSLAKALSGPHIVTNKYTKQLQYLGDSVLNRTVTEILIHQNPSAPVSKLNHQRSWIVSNRTLSQWGRAYRLNTGVKSGWLAHACAFEAHIGALAKQDPTCFNVGNEGFEWLRKIIEHSEKNGTGSNETQVQMKREAYTLNMLVQDMKSKRQ